MIATKIAITLVCVTLVVMWFLYCFQRTKQPAWVEVLGILMFIFVPPLALVGVICAGWIYL